MRTPCRQTQRPRQHGQDYMDIFEKLWRLLTDLKGTIRQKTLLGGIYKPNINNLKIWKSLFLKKIACPHSRGHAVFKLCNRISSRKQKVRETVFARSFGVHFESVKQKYGRKSHDTVPLTFLKLVYYCEVINLPEVCIICSYLYLKVCNI